MKYLIALVFSLAMVSFFSCEKVETTVAAEVPEDSITIVNGHEFFINADVSGTPMELYNNVDNVGNSVTRKDISVCGTGINTRFTSYFAYVSDTTRKQWIAFGLKNCISDSANGLNDSTYYVGQFPVEIAQANTPVGFIEYMDADSVIWSTSLYPNGTGAQATHFINITEVNRNFDSISALRIKGDFSGWVYNASGDSLLVNAYGFNTKAWSY